MIFNEFKWTFIWTHVNFSQEALVQCPIQYNVDTVDGANRTWREGSPLSVTPNDDPSFWVPNKNADGVPTGEFILTELLTLITLKVTKSQLDSILKLS